MSHHQSRSGQFAERIVSLNPAFSHIFSFHSVWSVQEFLIYCQIGRLLQSGLVFHRHGKSLLLLGICQHVGRFLNSYDRSLSCLDIFYWIASGSFLQRFLQMQFFQSLSPASLRALEIFLHGVADQVSMAHSWLLA